MRDFTVRAARPDEVDAVSEMVADIFSEGDTRLREQIRRYWAARLPHKPGFRPAHHHRVGIKDGEIAAYAHIERHTLCYGRARLHVAGIGSVCAHPNYRRQGYAAAVMRDAVAYMAEQGAHLSLLNGVAGYYDSFGFSPVWPFYTVEVASDEAAALDRPLRLRDVRPDDIPQMAALYEKHWGGRVTFDRSAEMWMWQVGDPGRYIQIVSGRDGQVAGYISGRASTGEEMEVVADSVGAAATLLAESGREHQLAGRKHIRWMMPPDDAFVTFARQLLTVTLSARYLPNGGWMARLIDTPALMEALLPEIVAQARSNDSDFDERLLVFNCQPDVVEIGMRGYRKSFCRLNHRDFIQVLFGSLRPSALGISTGLDLESVRLLEMLFPPRMAALASWDWF